jgi:hypothetical protein
VDKIAAAHVGMALESILLETALEPLTDAFGSLGSFGTSAIAQSLAQHDRSGFGALIAEQLARG